MPTKARKVTNFILFLLRLQPDNPDSIVVATAHVLESQSTCNFAGVELVAVDAGHYSLWRLVAM